MAPLTPDSLATITNRIVKNQQRIARQRGITSNSNPYTVAASSPTNHQDVARPEGYVEPGLGSWLVNAGSNIIDVLMRPLNAEANVMLNNDRNRTSATSPFALQGNPFIKPSQNNFQAAWQGLSGQVKPTFRDVIDKESPGAPEWVKSAGGLALDIGADPLNLVPGKVIAAPFKLASKGVRATKAAVTGSKVAEEADKVPALVGSVAKSADIPVEDAATIVAKNTPDPALIDSIIKPTEPIIPEGSWGVTETTPTVPKTAPIEAAPAITSTNARNLVNTLPPGVNLESYATAVNHLFTLEDGAKFRPSDLMKLGIKQSEAFNIVRNLEKEGFTKYTEAAAKSSKGFGRNTYESTINLPAMETGIDVGGNSAKIAESAAKINDAATTAVGLAPETIDKLAVANIATKGTAAKTLPMGLTPGRMGKMGEGIISKEVSKLKDAVTGKPLYQAGTERAQVLHDGVIPQWKATVEAEMAKGSKPELISSVGTRYLISMPHALDMLPKEAVQKMLFGAKYSTKAHLNNNLYHTQIQRGMAEALHLDDIHMPMPDRYIAVENAMRAAVAPNGKRVIAEQSIIDAAKTFVDHTVELRSAQYKATATTAHKDITDAAALTSGKVDQINKVLADSAATNSDIAGAIKNVGGDLSKAAKNIGASENATSIASHHVATATAEAVSESEIKSARTTSAIQRELSKSPDPFGAKTQTKIQEKVYEANKVVEKDALAEAGAGSEIIDLNTKINVQIEGVFRHLIMPFRTAFDGGYGFKSLFSANRADLGNALTARALYRKQLKGMLKKYGEHGTTSGWNAIRTEVDPAKIVDASTKGAHGEMLAMANKIFDTKNPYYGALFSSGSSINRINGFFKEAGIKFQFDLEKAGGDVEKMMGQWKDWDITNPLDFLDRAHSALASMAARQSIGFSFSRQFGHETFVPGMVRIADLGDKSTIGPYINKSLYYTKEDAANLTRFEHMLHQDTSFRNSKGALAGFVNHVSDPAMNIWKPYMTLAKPGYHFRNIIGDLGMSSLDGVKSPTHLVKSKRMMQAGGELEKSGLEGVDSIIAGSMDLDKAVSGAEKMRDVYLRGGKVQPLSYVNGYKLSSREGLLQTFTVQEDIGMDLAKIGAIGEKRTITDVLTQNKYMRGMGQVAEKTGHWTRLAHFDALMGRYSFTKNFDTIEEAAHAAADRVKKFHPDPQGLSPIERKYMRRLMPFYSWIKQALPLVLTTTVTHPGRITEIPKATYNAQMALGIDPHSVSDPFPTNKIFPSFITDSLTGPLLGNVGFNFGTPVEGVYGDLLNGNMLRNVANMTTPLAKTPLEMGTGTNIGTGQPIYDAGESADLALPIINQVSGISGYSVSGTIGSILQGKPTLDPQRVTARGEKESFWNTNLANFMAGLSAQDYGKPSYRKIAAKEAAG